MTIKQAKIPKKPRFEPRQTPVRGFFPVIFKKASEIEKHYLPNKKASELK